MKTHTVTYAMVLKGASFRTEANSRYFIYRNNYGYYDNYRLNSQLGFRILKLQKI